MVSHALLAITVAPVAWLSTIEVTYLAWVDHWSASVDSGEPKNASMAPVDSAGSTSGTPSGTPRILSASNSDLVIGSSAHIHSLHCRRSSMVLIGRLENRCTGPTSPQPP